MSSPTLVTPPSHSCGPLPPSTSPTSTRVFENPLDAFIPNYSLFKLSNSLSLHPPIPSPHPKLTSSPRPKRLRQWAHKRRLSSIKSPICCSPLVSKTKLLDRLLHGESVDTLQSRPRSRHYRRVWSDGFRPVSPGLRRRSNLSHSLTPPPPSLAPEYNRPVLSEHAPGHDDSEFDTKSRSGRAVITTSHHPIDPISESHKRRRLNPAEEVNMEPRDSHLGAYHLSSSPTRRRLPAQQSSPNVNGNGNSQNKENNGNNNGNSQLPQTLLLPPKGGSERARGHRPPPLEQAGRSDSARVVSNGGPSTVVTASLTQGMRTPVPLVSPVVSGFPMHNADQATLDSFRHAMQIKEQQRLLIQRRKEGKVAPMIESPGLGPPPSASVGQHYPPLLSATSNGSVGDRRGEAVKEKVQRLRVKTGRESRDGGEGGLAMKSAPVMPQNGGYYPTDSEPRYSARDEALGTAAADYGRRGSDDSIPIERDLWTSGVPHSQRVGYYQGNPDRDTTTKRAPMTAYPSFPHAPQAPQGYPGSSVRHSFATQVSSSRSTNHHDAHLDDGARFDSNGDQDVEMDDRSPERRASTYRRAISPAVASAAAPVQGPPSALPVGLSKVPSRNGRGQVPAGLIVESRERRGHVRHASFSEQPPIQHVYSPAETATGSHGISSARPSATLREREREPVHGPVRHTSGMGTGAGPSGPQLVYSANPAVSRFPPEAFTVAPSPNGTPGQQHHAIHLPSHPGSRVRVSPRMGAPPHGGDQQLLSASRESFLSPFNLFYDALLDANQLRAELSSRIRKANELVLAQESELERVRGLKHEWEEKLKDDFAASARNRAGGGGEGRGPTENGTSDAELDHLRWAVQGLKDEVRELQKNARA